MSYHTQGYNPSHGQPGQQYQYPPPSGPAFPGLQMPFAQAAFAQNHNLIPGLAFSNTPSQGAWNPPPPPAEPKLVPAARYYQPIGTPNKNVVAPVQKASQSAEAAVEEGEISEGQFDDLYEPADSTVIHHTDGPDDYDPANPGWMTAPTTQSNAPRITPTLNGTSKNAQGPASDKGGSSNSGREASGSYSPYLSPREYQTAPDQLPAKTVVHSEPQKYTAALMNAQATPQATLQAPSLDDIAAAKQQAQAAVLQLLPFNIGFDDYVHEGVDPSVLRSVFSELGLDPSVTTGSSKPQAVTTNATPRTQNATNASNQASPKVQQPTSTAPAASATSLADKKAEERKDRIARLWAAKATKNGSTQPSASAVQTGSDQPTLVSQAGRSEKEIKLQQKMDALQKSREARAQKAASKTDIPTVQPAAAQAVQAPEVTAKPPQQFQRGVSIPGLIASDTGPASSPVNTRKRPVAADFVDEAPLHVSKRPFGHDRGDRFVIDVSEESEDEDVEMELGSGDEAAVLRSGPYIKQTTSFREVPQLTDAFGRRQQFSSPGGKPTATPPNGLANMDKKIEEMKKKIALAEARKKLKMVLSGNRKGTTTPNSNLPTNDVSPGVSTPKPALRRVQSLDAPAASDELALSATGRSSPVLADAPVQLRLPKLSELSAEDRQKRQDRFRSLSHSLPLVDSKLQAKVKKLHLLQTQITRLEREIAQESAEKQQMEAELEVLQPAMEYSETPDADDTAEPSEELSDTTMADQPAPASEEPTPASASTSNPPDDEEVGGVALQPEASEPEATTAAISENSDVLPRSLDSSSKAGSVMESGSEGSVAETEEVSAAPVAEQEDVMQVDDEPMGQTEDSDDVVDLTNRDTDESPQASPEPQAGPSQISVGVNDSRPDQGLGGLRESRHGRSRQGDERVFKPYQSPFSIFRDFRYHPSFGSQVSGGLRSLTYSNKIDPKHPVCPNQLDGRQCPKGPDCEYQHFETMKLPDDQILLQLGGTKLEGAERARFNGGLRELLHDLREKNVKDFTRIAQDIVDYHNRFGGDPSKVLSLGDVPL